MLRIIQMITLVTILALGCVEDENDQQDSGAASYEGGSANNAPQDATSSDSDSSISPSDSYDGGMEPGNDATSNPEDAVTSEVDAASVTCPITTETCPTSCAAIQGRLLHSKSNCLADKSQLGCYPIDWDKTDDESCIKKVSTEQFFWLSSGSFAEYLAKHDDYQACSESESRMVMEAGGQQSCSETEPSSDCIGLSECECFDREDCQIIAQPCTCSIGTCGQGACVCGGGTYFGCVASGSTCELVVSCDTPSGPDGDGCFSCK